MANVTAGICLHCEAPYEQDGTGRARAWCFDCLPPYDEAIKAEYQKRANSLHLFKRHGRHGTCCNRPRECKRCGVDFERWENYPKPGSATTHCKSCYLAICRERQQRRDSPSQPSRRKHTVVTVLPSSCIYCLAPLDNTFTCEAHAYRYKRTQMKVWRSSARGRAITNQKKRDRRTGASSRARTMIRLLERDGFDCQMCGERMSIDGHDPMQVDHRVPLARGGGNDQDNLQLLHKSCNARKAAKLPDEADF